MLLCRCNGRADVVRAGALSVLQLELRLPRGTLGGLALGKDLLTPLVLVLRRNDLRCREG